MDSYHHNNVDVHTIGSGGDGHSSNNNINHHQYHHPHQRQQQQQQHVKWQTIIPGEVTCISGAGSYHHPSDGTAVGLCVIGCLDGSLHVLSLACGVHLGVPLVLGATVAYVDIHALSDPRAGYDSSSIRGSSSSRGSHVHVDPPRHQDADTDTWMRVLAVTADGEVYQWDVSTSTGRLRSTCRTSIRPVVLTMKSSSHSRSSGGGEGMGTMRSTNNNYNNSINTIRATTSNGISGRDSSQGAGKGMTTSISSSSAGSSRAIKAATTSTPSSTATNTPSSTTTATSNNSTVTEMYSVTVEKIILNARGSIELYALRRATSAEGGDWQGFCFCSDAQAWTRIVDMRHVLSRYCDP